MSLSDEFSSSYTAEQAEEFGEALLNKYGIEVCEAAAKIEQANIADGTSNSYKPQIRMVLDACDDLTPTPRDVADYISDTDKKSGTKSVMVSAMQLYYKVVGEQTKSQELADISSVEGITNVESESKDPIEGWITKEEMERIEEHIMPESGEKIRQLSYPDRSWVISYEHKALCMTLFYTACRVGEICKINSDDTALRVEDVNVDEGRIKLYRLKKSGAKYKRDMTPVPDKLIDVITDYLDLKGITEGPIFSFTTRTAQNRVSEIDEVYKYAFGEFEEMDTLTPHKFRHGRITDLANNSSLEAAGEYVDHQSVDTTNTYRHVTAEEQRDILPEEERQKTELTDSDIMEKLGVDTAEEALDILQEASDQS
jgi:integrase